MEPSVADFILANSTMSQKRVRKLTEKELTRTDPVNKKAFFERVIPSKEGTTAKKKGTHANQYTKKRNLEGAQKEKPQKETPVYVPVQKPVYIPLSSGIVKKVLPSVALSEYDKAPQLQLSKDQLTVYGSEGGYRMVRATHGVHRGSYYWEVEVLDSPGNRENAHVRVGWSTRQGELQGPVGFDKNSFGYRDIGGKLLHTHTYTYTYTHIHTHYR